MKRNSKTHAALCSALLVTLGFTHLGLDTASATPEPDPDQTALSNARDEGRAGRLNRDQRRVARREDIRPLPEPPKARLIEMAGRPHSFLPLTAFSEADDPSQLFMHCLLDTTGFQPNVFTNAVPGINDTIIPTAATANDGLPTIGSVRVVLEPKPGLATDPNDVRVFIARYLAVRQDYRLMPADPMNGLSHRHPLRSPRAGAMP